ncbi:MAG: fimbrillin family protein [Bacteroidetes bacterium]|uniref:Fimbrillin family protein n=1 Tax=Candidatus Cryptobacteroides gallistercoris TaxID=2840765 RepID=A0A940DM84_9BACT|nr:fimbrillin family protein [Candidatus Cryptobacteroides gallistercoris]
MKRSLLLGILPLAFLAGCQDNLEEMPVVPAQTGDEITFGSSLTDVDAQTRTIYGDKPVNGAYPVTWEDGDQIAIYCPEASNGNMVYYKVTPDGTDASHSSAVTKVNPDQAGLQWGQAEEHHFSAFYPADRILGQNEGGRLIAEIPVNQDPVEWKETENGAGGTTYTGVANTDYAFMWAYNKHNKSDGSDVALNFKPWVTILDVEINGPAQGTQKMSSIQIRSTANETLNGQFLIDFNPVEDGTGNAPTYIQYGNAAATRNQITIQFYNQSLNNGQGDFITLGPNDKIVVRFYLLPKDEGYDTSSGRTDLQIRLTPYNSAVLTRTLNGATDGEGNTQGEGGILAHKVNKVILPPVNYQGPNYWMSSLDPNIYVTELSLPGSRMSSLTQANDALTIYQDQTISEQFTNGVRAFYFQTMYENDGGLGLFEDPDYNLYLAVNGDKLNRFNTYIQDIANGLATAEVAGRPNEFAFVLLSWSSVTGSNQDRRWMQAVQEELTEMGNDSQYRLYTEEITPNTTIDDVKGKIIIKVNYNDQDMGNNLGKYADVPAMFALWGVPSGESGDDFYRPDGNDLRWGTSSSEAKATMKWVYQEATTVGPGGQISLANKKNYIRQMFESSVEAYQNNDEHNMWFMNDCGGSFVGNVTGDYVSGNYDRDENTDGAIALAHEMGIYVTNLLQSRTEDATLGIVYLNYANPTNPYSGNLIQTIINNNFNFQLRTEGSSQTAYNASYTSGGNAISWDK